MANAIPGVFTEGIGNFTVTSMGSVKIEFIEIKPESPSPEIQAGKAIKTKEEPVLEQKTTIPGFLRMAKTFETMAKKIQEEAAKQAKDSKPQIA